MQKKTKSVCKNKLYMLCFVSFWYSHHHHPKLSSSKSSNYQPGFIVCVWLENWFFLFFISNHHLNDCFVFVCLPVVSIVFAKNKSTTFDEKRFSSSTIKTTTKFFFRKLQTTSASSSSCVSVLERIQIDKKVRKSVSVFHHHHGWCVDL